MVGYNFYFSNFKLIKSFLDIIQKAYKQQLIITNMVMTDEKERLRLRWMTKDFMIGAGSPVTENQITKALDTNNHMTGRIIEEFKEAQLIKPFPLGVDTKNPKMAWNYTDKLKKINKEDLKKLIEIKKPRVEDKNK